ADIYSLVERAKVIGYLASVWAVSSVVGPALGGIFSDYVSWRWIFFINIPLALLAMGMLQRGFTERLTRTSHRIDYLGAVLLSGGGALLILGLLAGGVNWAWDSPASIAVLGTAAVLLVLFGLVERRAPEPILPLWVFRRRVLIGSNATSLCVGALLIGLNSYVPLYAQNVLGTSAVVGGFAVAALTLGWPVAATLSGRIYLRVGFRNTALLGAALAILGGIVLVTVTPASGVWQLASGCAVIGAGLGFMSAPALVAAQASADWQTRGVVTGATLFARSVGSAVGIAVFGAVVNASVTAGGSAEHLPADVLATAIHGVYLGVLAVAVIAALCVLVMPGGVPAAEPAPEPSTVD
ncbi:MAG TPA: MFS transporter, partial [Micromonosporaceae bacterium]|nr:MFS transporter [Micromonosporaceae bacterium]